jgi:uncharacterized metal-binding protein
LCKAEEITLLPCSGGSNCGQIANQAAVKLDEDRENALRFLKKHLSDKVKGTLEGAGHCRPYFEVFGQSIDLSQCDKPGDK